MKTQANGKSARDKGHALLMHFGSGWVEALTTVALVIKVILRLRRRRWHVA